MRRRIDHHDLGYTALQAIPPRQPGPIRIPRFYKIDEIPLHEIRNLKIIGRPPVPTHPPKTPKHQGQLGRMHRPECCSI